MSTNHRGVTVFVRRMRGVFLANTLQADAIDASATVAAVKCAATHFGVSADQIELTPNGAHTMIACVRQPQKITRWPLRTALAIAAATALVCAGIALLAQGGAR